MEIILALALFLIFLIILALGLVVVVLGTLKKGKMGINLAKTGCAQCGEPMPAIRKPANLRQALWGGWTCKQCGTENDKWGRQIRP
jgi:hypothetical protein